MTIDKTAVPTKLLWVDLEMTGLNVHQDVILEVAAIVTDFQFQKLGSYEAIINQPEEKLQAMNEWAANQHGLSGLTERVRHEGKPEVDTMQEFAAFIGQHFGDEPAVLAGNSIHNDRNFIKQWWPSIDTLLHYRMLDVSSWKIVMQAKYGATFPKAETHRALDDIEASIAELVYYLSVLKS